MSKIIVVAQDRLERAYVGAQLLEEGFKVEGHRNIVDAIRQITENKIQADLVIIDAKNQRMDKEIVTILN